MTATTKPGAGTVPGHRHDLGELVTTADGRLWCIEAKRTRASDLAPAYRVREWVCGQKVGGGHVLLESEIMP